MTINTVNRPQLTDFQVTLLVAFFIESWPVSDTTVHLANMYVIERFLLIYPVATAVIDFK